MRGSIAIWQDKIADAAEGYAPRVEVHVNIWRNTERNKYKNFDLLDIGFRLQEIRSLRTLSISLPFAVIDDSHISDLFEVMHDASTLSAIFNETLAAGGVQDDGRIFAASIAETERVQFYVARCSPDERLLSKIGVGGDEVTVITLKDSFFERLRRRVGDHYFRLRVKLPIEVKNGFVSTIKPKDSAFLSTISTNEIVEFRLNERRNFSGAIREKLQATGCGLIDVSAVHYFLIRDMGVEMTQSHTGFRKMRRLEPEMWSRYLQGCPGMNPDKMIIYHWSSKLPAHGPVDSFTALATFRAYYTGSLVVYGLVIVALGAMGSALQSLLMGGLAWLGWSLGCSAPACVSAAGNLLVMIALFLALFGCVWFRR
ncbi:hypothetical protein [Methylobacterium gossipiicola]|uniref:Uncharacterized protein n=1 Tax=Methylobacterium gossipiicola TaxID=582675 RepID=A0A1I2RW94_9HYPH|nr:hypothetical protein [Methylobacterium gossipiicola]SFG44838.1 hypothetical protein SAMN05192565_103208 [Methylobacterium gossipiicola]